MKIKTAERQRQALALRAAGRTFDEIAEQLGYASHSGAIDAVRSILRRTEQEAADHYRELTLERLTAVLRYWWPVMMGVGHKTVTLGKNGSERQVPYDLEDQEKATRLVLRAIAQMRTLLGLDAPIKIADPDGRPLKMTVLEFVKVMVDKGTDANGAVEIIEGQAREV